ncbi:Chaperone protein DnaK [Streptomyces sp. YIM 130001]|uniref:Hsp70 family protein n=1 Tax=Streptomyces sp. YIM 130001 TaxID=2259644 RepID=UPI000E65A2F2|nr:Hsp70 family protein [Streptomyces sp. YIM 130001]RII15937.1 Chaperone protein DnaK [Streptomyces sp. YIM 130001]
MSSLVVGIDLGTTNSCVAVPAQAAVPDKERLIAEGRLRPVGDALVVVPPDGSPTVPSAVWVGPDGDVQVGLLAKHRARMQGAPPAMFFKRSMGTDQRFTAGHAELTPVEASTAVLRHLRAIAEDVLGVPVERAVVTVPAFFETRSKNDTTRAGDAAGLEVVETLIEPVAAALAHGGDQASGAASGADAAHDGPRTLLVYDLGGGTFDTSVVTRDPDEGFEHRAFGGDRYLGGYDFDRAVVSWMNDRLPAYDLAYDPDSPADARSYASLLFLAEGCKQELSRMPVTEIVSQYCEDRNGIPMNLHLPMQRGEFESVVRPHLQAAADHCERTLRQAGLTPADVDEIVMVGGSSRIPLAATLLRERFGREPVLLHPDLAIAAGAALKAAEATERGTYLELDRPEADGEIADISGRVLPGELLPDPAGAAVLLVSDDGVHRVEETAGPNGSFLFPDVPLTPGAENGFTVRLMRDGRAIEARRVTVTAATASAPVTGDVLAHDFSVELAEGLHRIVDSGVRLPHRTGFRLQTATQGSYLSIRLYEGLMHIGSVEIADVPRSLPVGTDVEVSVTFEAGWTIEAEVAIPAIGAAATAVIDIPLRRIPAWDDLRRAHRDAKQAWAELHDGPGPGTPNDSPAADAGPESGRRSADGVTALNRLLGETDALLTEGQDRAKTHYKIMETETLLQGLAQQQMWDRSLDPSPADFETALAEARTLVAELARTDPARAESHRSELVDLEAAARTARADRNRYAWHQACTRLDSLRHGARTDLGGPESARSADSFTADEIAGSLLAELEQLRRSVQEADEDSGRRHRAEADAFTDRIGDAVGDVVQQAAREDDTDTRRRLIGIYKERIEPLHAQIGHWLRGLRQAEGVQVVLPRTTPPGQGN